MNNKFLSLLGMARKAGKTEFGYDKALGEIHTRKAKVIFCASDLSEKTKRGLVFAAEDTNINVITVSYSMFEITTAVGMKTGVVCITDSGFAKALLKIWDSTESTELTDKSKQNS